MFNRFRRHPFYWQVSAATAVINIITKCRPTQSKIAYFRFITFRHQDVPGGYVSVDEMTLDQVFLKILFRSQFNFQNLFHELQDCDIGLRGAKILYDQILLLN